MKNCYEIEVLAKDGLYELAPIILASPIKLKMTQSEEIGQYILEQSSKIDDVIFKFLQLVGYKYVFSLSGIGVTESLVNDFSEFLKILDLPHKVLKSDTVFLSFLWNDEVTKRVNSKLIENEYHHFLDKFDNFKYPEKYITLQDKENCLADTNWWFIGSSKGASDLCFININKNLKSKKLLIPFAINNSSNTAIVCFDINGRVYICVDEQNLIEIDWEKRFYYKNFDDWLEKMINESL
jgi:hypothetical protein